MAAELQQQMMNLIEHNRALNQEVVNVNVKLTYLDNEQKTQEYKIKTLESTNQQLITELNKRGSDRDSDRGERGERELQINLINTKQMAPKVFAGKPEENFKTWAKKLRAYCNGSRPGFRGLLKWIEEQKTPIDPQNIDIEWKYKNVANEVLHDFLVLHTSDDALVIVELQGENGLEGWRQLNRRYDPIGESYAIDQMGHLIEHEPVAHLVDMPAAIAKWEKRLSAYAARTGGKSIPEDWRIPLLFKMLPKSQKDDKDEA